MQYANNTQTKIRIVTQIQQSKKVQQKQSQTKFNSRSASAALYVRWEFIANLKMKRAIFQ